MDLLTAVMNSSDTAQKLEELIQFLSQPGVKQSLAMSDAQQLDNMFRSLDPTHHTLGCIAIMEPRLGKSEAQAVAITSMNILLAAFDPAQARLWPGKFAATCHAYMSLLMDKKQPIRGVLPLLQATYKFRPTPEHLTPLHAMVVQLAYHAKCHHAVLPLLDTPVTEVSVKTTAVNAGAVLHYFYYGGQIQADMQQYGKAQDLFLAAVCVPAQTAHPIAVEAYKKYCLMSLLATGCVPTLPSYCPKAVLRECRQSCQAYNELAEVFQAHDTKKLTAYVRSHKDTFSNDGNLALARQCADALCRNGISRLTRTFMTLSLADIAENVGLASAEEAEKYTVQVIGSGQIRAKVCQKDGMVSFLEASEGYDTSAVLDKIDQEIRGTIHINEKLAETDRAMALMEVYQAKCLSLEAFRKSIAN